ncbi:MAG: hypothetical protein Q8909_20280, partial [Bacteroidota bacterium]|nr:hypothetical protein [Bacteroidota bacterium]
LKYLSEKFPNSEYLPIIKGLMGRQQLNTTNKTGTEESAVIIGRSIRSLKELMQVEGIKGKCAYIDLWATYCMPCKFQFQYNIDLHKLLNSYNNLVTVYISIDDEKDEPMWRNQIQYYHLFGYNLIASKELKNDIQQRLLKGAPLLVPRYLLVDENANSLNNNLPRPQALLILKEELDKTLK